MILLQIRSVGTAVRDFRSVDPAASLGGATGGNEVTCSLLFGKFPVISTSLQTPEHSLDAKGGTGAGPSHQTMAELHLSKSYPGSG